MTAPSIGCKDLLVTANVGVYYPTLGNWQIYISKLPAEPDNVIALFDTGGLAPEPRWLLDYPDVSVLVRSNSYGDAYTKMREVFDALLGIPAQDINGDRFDGIISIAHPTFIGYDQSDRAQFSATFRLFVEPGTSALTNRDPL